ncbi:uncharacterized protein LOC114901300 isoform X2 [Monodon monoceros]|uniref:uncharacterized protein LOC114901300 isoform X2 n=1 Tax=Monodon monoceros TaxID=40151 RepID=UPI0010F8D842|nr:uncharacterized protein LOC114901300 isoform X2 [Monodon monoceros]
MGRFAQGRAELQRQGHRTCPRTPVSAGPARLTGAAPACVSGEGWGLRRCHGCEVSKAVWEGAGRGHGSSGHPSRQRKKTRNREGLDPRAKGEPCPYLRVGVSGKLATGLEFPRGALEASKQLHQVHRPTSAPRLIREERKYVGRQKPELGSPTPLNPGIWMPGDSGSLRLLRQPQPEPGVAGPRGQHGRGGDDSRSCRGPEVGEAPGVLGSPRATPASHGLSSGRGAHDKEFCFYGRWKWAAELPHGGHSGATTWWPQRSYRMVDGRRSQPSPGILSCPETKWQHLQSWSLSPTRRHIKAGSEREEDSWPRAVCCAGQGRDTGGPRTVSEPAAGSSGQRGLFHTACALQFCRLSPYAGPHICGNLLEGRCSCQCTKAQGTPPLPHPHPPSVSAPTSAFLKQLSFPTSSFLLPGSQPGARKKKNQVTLPKQLMWHPRTSTASQGARYLEFQTFQ